MAIEYDISGLLGKTENEGSTDAGRLTATEWNKLVSAVQEVQTKSEGTIKGIKYNGGAEAGGQTFSNIDAQGYLQMTVADSSGYQLTTYIDNPPAYIARGSECILKVRVSSKQVQGDDLIPATAACSVNLYLNGAPTPFYSGNVYDMDSTTPGVVKELVVDITKIPGLALLTGELDNEIKIEINNRFGKISQAYCYVKVIELGLSVDIFGTKNVFTETDKPQLIARISGTDGVVTAFVDGVKILPTGENTGEAFNGVDMNFGQDIFNTVNTHGVHTIEVSASVTRQTGTEDIVISTVPQKFNYIYGTTNTRPVVMSVINNTTPEEYSNFEMSYVAYKYNSTAAAVTDTVNVSLCAVSYDADGNPVAGTEYITVSQDVTFDPTTNSGTGSAMFSLFPVDNVSLVGKKAIKISIGDFSQIAEIEVKASDIKLNQLGGYAVYLTANNRSNNEPADTLKVWRSTGKDRAGNTLIVDTEFDDNIEFIDTGSGWIADSDGNMAMHLRKGRFFTLNYCPFDDNPTYNDNTNRGNGRGKTISLEFATRNCLDQNSKVIECLDSSNGQERGFIVTASSATLKANTFDLGIEFKEDSRIRIDFVIEGKQTKYIYDTVSGKEGTVYKGESDEALAIVYVDGVYQGLKVIPVSTSFLQGNSSVDPAKIRFGSNDCDLDVYSIRIYDQALTPLQIVNNYSYDTPNFNDKIAIAKRNNIFDETSTIANKPNINIEKLRLARPELPFFYVRQPLDEEGQDVILPQNKSDWLKVPFTEWKNPMNETDKGEAAISWTTEKGRWKNQGTSSMSYPWPWRNWDWQLKYDKDKGETPFTFGDGTTGDKWNQYKGMDRAGAIKKITLKKDYASSEMCNNAITSEYFTDMALAIGNEYPNVLSPAQRLDGADTTPFRLTFIATPCFLFQQFNDSTKIGTAGSGYEALGMMNLIPNKNECDHLGFGKKSGFAWGSDGTKFDRAQSWELADNKDGWFWYKKLNGIIRNTDGTFENDLEECYEARYPKDTTTFKNDKGKFDGDFGLVPEGKTTMTTEEAASLMDEQKDIIEFHNWLVDVNRQICEDYKKENGEYRKLNGDEENIAASWNSGTWTHDTPEYRLAKFTAEAPTRLIIDQFCLYYIWREMFWGFDSGFKNLQVYTMGKANDESAYCQWGCMVRDADTTLGIDNLGVKKFPPHLEDIDFMIENADGTRDFNYGGAKGMYHAQSIADAGGNAILNGQLGSLWINLRDAFGTKITDIYRALSGSTKSNWNSTRSIKRFRDHQEKWCENLYNFGMRQYFGGEPFTTWIASGLGDKKNSRASWLSRAFYYRNSKYNVLGDGDYCKVRACCYSTPDNVPGVENEITSGVTLKFKAYIPMYVGLGASEEKMAACKNFMRITDVTNTFDVTPGPDGLNFPLSEAADENTWFYGTSQLTELGDLARGCKIKEFASISLPKLRELNLGHEKDRDGVEYQEYYVENDVKKIRPFSNRHLKAMNCSTLKQLTLLDITNHTMVNAVNGLNNCDQLQELYARGTDALSTINLPATTALRVLYLGKNLVTLNLTDLTGIQRFELEGADQLTQLFIRNCGSYMGERSYDIMTMAIGSLERVYDPKTNNNVCQLTGINWTNGDSSYLERLLNIEATLSGYVKVKDLSNDLKVRLIAAYGNIDDPNNGLHIEYNQKEITNAKLPSKMYFHVPGKHQLKFTVTPASANTYSSAVWSIASNPYAGFANETDAANGILTRYEGEANQQTSAKLTVTIKQLPYSNGDPRQDIVLESTIYFYERLAKPGDYVFHDGSYSDELDDSKTPVGVCFYVDPKNANNRLMMALESITYNSNTMAWGLGTGGNNTDGSGNITGYFGSPQQISIDGEDDYNCFDLSKLPNITIPGVTIGVKDTNYFTDEYFRDPNADDNGYFASFGRSSYFGDLGWKPVDYRIYVDKLKMADGSNGAITLNVSDIVPSGYYNTLAIIEHRNKILDNYSNEADKEFIRPYSDDYTTELESVRSLGQKADGLEIGGRKPSIANTAGSHLYYPAASVAFAYQPKASGLIDKFKAHNWFLPSSGELLRICYYAYQSYKDGVAQAEPVNSAYDSSYNEPANAFYIPIKDGKLSMNYLYSGVDTSGTLMWSSTETSGEKQSIAISSNNGSWEQRSKSSTGAVRPVCRF